MPGRSAREMGTAEGIITKKRRRSLHGGCMAGSVKEVLSQ